LKEPLSALARTGAGCWKEARIQTLFLRTLTGAAALCLVCLPALAQTTGSIRGQIKDEQGNPLPGVTVTVTSQGRGTSHTVVTGDAGSFAVPALAVEVYDINAVLTGFQEQVVENVRVGISSSVTLDLVMRLATVEDTIVVSGSPLLNATSSSVGTNFEAEFIEDLPTTRNFWDMMASYTWSDSSGFLATPLAQDQGDPAWTGQAGRDPNNWINAEQALQNQRRHAVQVQSNVDMPWKLRGTLVYRYLSGKPYNRQVQAGVFSSQFPLAQGGQTVIAVPASEDTRFSDQNVLDLSLGRSFEAGPTTILIDLQLFNVFNNDAHDSWQTLVVAPGDAYYPRAYVLPRRLGLRLGLRF